MSTALWRVGSRPLVLLGLALVCAGACSARPPESDLLKPEGAVKLPGVEGRFDHFAADLIGGRLFVAALGNNTLEALGEKGAKRLRGIGGMREPQGVAFAPGLNRIFVGNGSGATCDVLDGTTLERVARIPGLDDADNVRYDSGAKRVYVGYGDGALAVIDAAAAKLAGKIPLAGHPESFQLEAKGPRIWVNVPSAGEVAVIDRKREKVTATWRITGAGANFPMAIDEAHHRLFLGCRRPARLLAYDTETGNHVAAVEIVGDTDDLFYDAERSRIYVAGGGGEITVISQETPDRYRVVGRVTTAPGARTAYFVPQWRSLFVAVPHRDGQQAEVRRYAIGP
jgi:DNA-binding beta-propeller fold protein YncE